MACILIVDDEPAFRELLSAALESESHEIHTAATGREAIETGALCRPDVLVVDWLLGGRVHGLHVADALRTIRPDTRILLMTGYLTDDLRGEADRVQALDCLEKPFELERFRTAIRTAMNRPLLTVSTPALAVAVIDSRRTISHRNSLAAELFARITGQPDTKDFAAMFDTPQAAPDLAGAVKRWIDAPFHGALPGEWRLRSRKLRDDGTHLVVFRRSADRTHSARTLAGLLLDIPEPGDSRWTLSDHVLIADARPISRTVTARSLGDAGCTCHAADGAPELLRLLELDRQIRTVLLDVGLVSTGRRGASRIDTAVLDSLANDIQRVRPGCTIILVGSDSPSTAAAIPEQLNIRHWLREPWSVDDLLRALTGRIGPCFECGLPLPLRRPGAGEQPADWRCKGCGASYTALMLDENSADLHANVRRSA